MFIRLWPGVGRVQVLGSKKTEEEPLFGIDIKIDITCLWEC